MNRTSVRFALFTVAALLLPGCYKYTPTEAALATPGEDLRVSVTRLGAAELADATDGSASGTISGRMELIEDDDLVLRVPVGERQQGFTTVDLVQTVRVPMGEVLLLERRELDPVVTGFVVGGVVAGAAALIYGIIEAFGEGNSNNDPEPPLDAVVFNLLSLPWGY